MSPQTPVAVIGMAARAPGAEDMAGFWNLLAEGRCTSAPVPPDRLLDYRADLGGIEDPHLSLLDDVVGFEPGLFGITPRLATWMDPQQRMMLESAWHALESAGIPPDSLAGREVGVFVSTTCSDMRDRMAATHLVDTYSAVGLLLTFVSSRISHQFDLRGPSITLDTSCAGGLTTVHQAVTGLRAGDFGLAITGAPNVYLHGHMQAVMQKFGAITPTGQARCFSAGADGYVRGEGVFSFVLKLLPRALADGDPVLAVIRGSAVNHDGRRGGLTRSDPASQVELVRKALAQAELPPQALGYVECHAAGTPKGDPIEAVAMRDLVRDSDGPVAAGGPGKKLWLGSVKANIGHLEGGAGAASLAKAVQVLRYRTIPMIPGVSELHPDVPEDRDPVAVATATTPWPDEGPRVVGVTALGVGGANAHVVLSEAPELPTEAFPRATRWAVPVSARTPGSLDRLVSGLARLLREGDPDPAGGPGIPAPDFAAAVWTLQSGRAQLRTRLVLTAADAEEFAEAARSFARGEEHPDVHLATETGRLAELRAAGLLAAEAETAQRWLAGDTVDWAPTWPGTARPRRVPLVAYPFERRRCWPEAAGPLAETP
ncbi:acyl transferase domain-containing protein [Crossiella equi]|uniref:Acyl transferase domain-containing protein n=1 Tax=Crossiella equi TaxID=130796 RepID=A0ABS5AS86_9PSEU|nr:polyketide synthase [Crossiella equi]MBP2479452.1 acyl transferase domain-containing protein [Crossiella equi]